MGGRSCERDSADPSVLGFGVCLLKYHRWIIPRLGMWSLERPGRMFLLACQPQSRAGDEPPVMGEGMSLTPARRELSTEPICLLQRAPLVSPMTAWLCAAMLQAASAIPCSAPAFRCSKAISLAGHSGSLPTWSKEEVAAG